MEPNQTRSYEISRLENTPVDKLYRRAKLMEAPTLKNFIERVSKLPLAFHPGEPWRYYASADMLGYLVQVISGMTFNQCVQKRILEPLRMGDTYFFLPKHKEARLAMSYQTIEGKLQPWSESPKRTFPSGGGGLLSTTGDFARFGQMLLNGGQLDGVRILSRKTVELMLSNQLVGMQRPTLPGTEAYGFGGLVRIDLAKGDRAGSIGEFGWDGADSTFFRIDPKERTIVLLFMQQVPPDFETFDKYMALFYTSFAD